MSADELNQARADRRRPPRSPTPAAAPVAVPSARTRAAAPVTQGTASEAPMTADPIEDPIFKEWLTRRRKPPVPEAAYQLLPPEKRTELFNEWVKAVTEGDPQATAATQSASSGDLSWLFSPGAFYRRIGGARGLMNPAVFLRGLFTGRPFD